MKVFLDANILFAASLPGSLTSGFLKALQERANAVSSPYAFDEAERNLCGKQAEAIETLRAFRDKLTVVTEVLPVPDDVELPDKDAPILGAAIAAECTHLVTGDLHHFGSLMGRTIAGVKVSSVRDITDEMIRRGWAEED